MSTSLIQAALFLLIFVSNAALTVVVRVIGGPQQARIPALITTGMAPLALAWSAFGATAETSGDWALLSLVCVVAAPGAWLALILTRRASRRPQPSTPPEPHR